MNALLALHLGADAIAVCRIRWTEAMAALARRQREDSNSGVDLEQARQQLIQCWQTFTIVEINQAAQLLQLAEIK